MINLMIKNIFENSNKIDAVVNHINKTDRRYSLMFLLVAANVLITSKLINKLDEKIINLEIELEEMKSKGE